eukprot:664291-Amphidinium_carterae.2
MVCWTIDFLLGFVTGYYHEGVGVSKTPPQPMNVSTTRRWLIQEYFAAMRDGRFNGNPCEAAECREFS